MQEKYFVTNPSNQVMSFLSTDPFQSFTVDIETRFTTFKVSLHFFLPLTIPICERELKIGHPEIACARARLRWWIKAIFQLFINRGQHLKNTQRINAHLLPLTNLRIEQRLSIASGYRDFQIRNIKFLLILHIRLAILWHALTRQTFIMSSGAFEIFLFKLHFARGQ